MTDFLVKYVSETGKTRVVDPNNDPIAAKSIILEGKTFDKFDIATVSSFNALEASLTSVSGALNSSIASLTVTVNSNEAAKDIEISDIHDLERSDFEAFQLLADDVKSIQEDDAFEELIVAVSGQTIVTLSGFTISTQNSITDFLVFVNGIKKNQSKTGVSGFGLDFKKNDQTHFEFFQPLTTGDKILSRKERRLVNSNRNTYFREYVTNKIGRSIPLSQRYKTGVDGLWLFRNGVYLSKTRTLGFPVDRFDEASSMFLTVDTILDGFEVMTALNINSQSSYRFYDQGVTGSSLTIPTYTTGNSRLVVFRNGLIMIPSAIGGTIQRYTEASTTSIGISVAATADEIFSFEYLSSVTWRQDQIVATGTTVTFASPYVMGDDRLLLFRDGLLMNKSTSLGDQIDRYTETTTSTVTLGEAATGEVFTAIYL